jgi:hypothetical protein
MDLPARHDARENTRVAAHRRWAQRGTTGAAAIVVAAATTPIALGVDVQAGTAPPLLADWRPRLGPGTIPAMALAAIMCAPALPRVCGRLPWRWLLGAAWLFGAAWLLSLAAVDGLDGVSRPLDQDTEYLPTARAVDDVPATLRVFIDRIPFDHPNHWAVHVAGHPPGALLLFVALVRLGLGTGLAAGLFVVAVAATTPLAVAVTLRALGGEDAVRVALPFLVIGPAAIWQAVSADAVFAAVSAWGAAALALAATAYPHLPSAWHGIAWSALGGALLGVGAFLSYGLVLLGLLAVGVLAAARQWRPLVVAAPAALGVAAVFAGAGFAWWEAFPALRQRYWDGIAGERPAFYWLWANLAALALCAGPVVAGAVSVALARIWDEVSAWRTRLPRLIRRADRAVLTLVAAAVAMVAVADLSLMSKAEVERIWLPFVPWLMVSVALLPPAWRRPALASQAALALVVQHLLWIRW